MTLSAERTLLAGTSRQGSLLLGCLLIGSFASPVLAQAGTRGNAPGPPPRERVSGIRALSTKSRIVYRSAPDRPHMMEAAFAFPERGRWRLIAESPTPSPSRARFQLGRRVYAIDPPEPASRLLESEERATALRGLSLRRALMLWPHTVDWKRAGNKATADLGSAGRMVARFADAELPISIASETAAGEEYERFTGITWGKLAGDPFKRPTAMKLEAGGQVIWDETVLEYEARADYVDSFFLPTDQREERTATLGQQVEILPLPARTVRRWALDPEADWQARWKAALAIAEKTDAELAATGDKLHPGLAFELDSAARPTALVLRLAAGEGDGGDAPPEGWVQVPGGQGASLFLTRPAALRPQHVTDLQKAALGAERTPGVPYMVIRRAAAPGRSQLVLPLHE